MNVHNTTALAVATDDLRLESAKVTPRERGKSLAASCAAARAAQSAFAAASAISGDLGPGAAFDAAAAETCRLRGVMQAELDAISRQRLRSLGDFRLVAALMIDVCAEECGGPAPRRWDTDLLIAALPRRLLRSLLTDLAVSK